VGFFLTNICIFVANNIKNMATKNRKVETRLDDGTYKLLEQIAEDCEISIYELVQRFIMWGVESRKPLKEQSGGRIVSGVASKEAYKMIEYFSNKKNISISEVVTACINRVYDELVKDSK